MPKYDLFLKPGDTLDSELRLVLEKHFTQKDFAKLLKFGGRIQISIAAPFTDRKLQNKSIVIDSEFVEHLKNHPSDAEEKIRNLNKKQLLQIALELKIQTNSKSSIKEIRKTIVDLLRSANNWSSISNS